MPWNLLLFSNSERFLNLSKIELYDIFYWHTIIFTQSLPCSLVGNFFNNIRKKILMSFYQTFNIKTPVYSNKLLRWFLILALTFSSSMNSPEVVHYCQILVWSYIKIFYIPFLHYKMFLQIFPGIQDWSLITHS